MSEHSTQSEVLDALQSVTGYVPSRSGDGYKARCPAHDDHDPSLSVSEGSDGRVLLNCHADCEPSAICAAIGWQLSDLFPGSTDGPTSTIETVYPFHDENGRVLFEEVRLHPKGFRLRQPDGTWNLKRVRRVPFRLPALLRAGTEGGQVLFVEGPKDASRLEAEGFCATTVPTGAMGWREEFAEYFRGVELVICGDHDRPGQALVDAVRRSVTGTAASIKVIDLYPGVPLCGDHGEDVSDWFSQGGTAEELQIIIDNTPSWTPSETPSDLLVPLNSALFVNVGALMRQPRLPLVPDMLKKSDGSGLFLRGTVGMLIGMPEVGKSWLTIELVRQVVSNGENAVVLDWEGPAWRFANRLMDLGATPAQGDLVQHHSSGSIALDVLADEVLRYEPALVIIDSAAKLYADHDWTRNPRPELVDPVLPL